MSSTASLENLRVSRGRNPHSPLGRKGLSRKPNGFWQACLKKKKKNQQKLTQPNTKQENLKQLLSSEFPKAAADLRSVEIIFSSQITNWFDPSALFQIRLPLWLLSSTCLFWHLENEPSFKKEKEELVGEEMSGRPAAHPACGMCTSKTSAQKLPASDLPWGDVQIICLGALLPHFEDFIRNQKK